MPARSGLMLDGAIYNALAVIFDVTHDQSGRDYLTFSICLYI